MLKKSLPLSIFLLVVIASSSYATASELAISCRLKGGSMVKLSAETCTLEGGTPITDAAPVEVAPAAVILDNSQFSDDPKLAAAQRAVIVVLNKTVVDRDTLKGNPEGVERSAKFDGCRLLVDESMHVDHGNLFSARLNFKITSSVDLRKVSNKAFGVLGKVTSYGGGMKAYAVYFEERVRNSGNDIAISVMEQRKDGARRYTLPGVNSFWDAPNADLWILDEYGYPKENNSGSFATDTVRILFMLNTAEDAVALNKALGEVHAICKP